MNTLEISGEKILLQEISPFEYQGKLGYLDFVCKRWNWGQKNFTLDISTRYQKTTHQYYTDNVVYNENMIQICLISLQENGKKTSIHEVPADLGDSLLEICLWVNQQISQDIPISDAIFQENQYIIDQPNLRAVFKKWSWGEKINAVKLASIYNSEAQEMHLNTGKFGELLLLSTLVSLEWKKNSFSIDLKNIQSLPVDLGEFLVEIAVKINTIPSTEKKT